MKMVDKLKNILGEKYLDHVAPADDYLVISTGKDYAISLLELEALALSVGSERITVSGDYDVHIIVVRGLTNAREYNLHRTV